MAMNGDTCGGLIMTELQPILQAAFSGNFDNDLMRKVCNAIGAGVVKHIQQSGVVTTTVTGTCSTGPITGTGTGKVQ